MSVNVRSIVKQYLSHAKGYYRIARAGGGSEVANLKHALRPFSRMFGRLLVEELAVRHLRAYRDGLARKKLCRTTINARVHRVRRCFRWAEEYDTHAVRRAIARACAKAGVECFAPHSIRHAYATRMAAKYGLQITTFLLGHSRTDTTMIYAHVEEARVLAALGI